MFGFLWSFPLGLKITLGLLGLLFFLVYRYLTSTFDHWKKKGVKFIKPWPIAGSTATIMLMKEHLLHFHQRVYKEYEGEPFIGFFQGRLPTLMIFDTELIKRIFVKDFSHFVDHGFKMSEEADPLNALNLFNVQGQRWKDLRTKLVPTFTSGKMKGMFPLIQECTERFDEHLDQLAKSGEIFEAKNLLGCLFTDVIGSCIFGINCNTIKEPNNEFRVMGKRLIDVTPIQAFKGMLVFLFNDLALKLKIGVTDPEVTEFFKKLTLDLVAHRKKNNIVRKDFLQLLMELKENGRVSVDDDDEDEDSHLHRNETSNNIKFDDIDMVAQASVFFLAGFETSSTVISFALLELAANPDVQRKAQIEIDELLAQADGKVTYESLKEMKYLDWILQESMRKYPPVAVHFRECSKTYKIPDTDKTLEKGDMVTIPNHALQNDPKYFPNPDRFDPERFNDDDFLHKHQYIYSPFGEGPRQCIGNRFAIIQSKMALLVFLRKYTISFTAKTVFPIELDIKQFILTTKDGIWLKMEHRGEE
ncbi:Hypothetical predicted protein [Cloeon dipterum]|uniref:Cytochrome P450 n=1 Tax=Cloeon dipterum TaxID=197152 RepID=A0A8S1CAQ1_9INSE|nr:Hypothetical predicted protein [Cloeon dipterum]